MVVALLAALVATIPAATVSDDFSSADSLKNWRAVMGQWNVGSGRAATSLQDRSAWLVWRGLTPPQQITAEVKITPRKGQVPGQWCAAGLAIFLDMGNYWRLALVENATNKGLRYFELVERYRDIWQAQVQGATTLRAVERAPHGSWDYGHTYLFRLSIGGGRVRGEIFEAGKLLWRKTYEVPDAAPAVRTGWPALTTVSMGAEFSSFRAQFNQPQVARPPHKRPQAAVLHNTLTGAEPQAEKWVTDALRRAGFDVVALEPTEAGTKSSKSLGSWDLLVIPSAQVVPAGTGWLIERYLTSGGCLMVQAADTPFKAQLVRVGDQWMSPADAQAQAGPVGTLFKVTPQTPQKLRFGSDAPKISHSLAAEPAPKNIGGWVLHARLGGLRSWANWSGSVDGHMTRQNGAVSFWAKGDANTHYLVLELDEDDQSRWIAAVPLKPKWQRCVLAPHDFKFWPDCPARGRRGFATDSLRPEHVVRLSLGLARSHAPHTPGPKQLWISSIRFCPIVAEAKPSRTYVPELDGIYPWYKTFRHPSVRRLATAPGTVWPKFETRYAGALRSAYARPWGRVMTGVRSRRWIPIIQATDAEGRHSYPAALLVRSAGAFAGASWSFWGLPASALQAGGDALKRVFGAVGRAQVRGVWMMEAGPDQVAYMPGQSPKWGASVANASGRPQTVELILRAQHGGRPAGQLQRKLTAPPSSQRDVLSPWNAPGPGVYDIVAELRQGGDVIDRLRVPVRILDGRPDSKDSYVRVDRGRFWVGDRTWFPHGVNFWPRYVAGLAPHDYGLGWQTRAHYDPVLVEEDLAIAQSLGITAVSIQAPRSADDLPCLWDFLERCKAHSIRVNLFVPVDPRGFDPDYVRSIIAGGQLWKFSAIYAYDITWEPRWGNYRQRSRFDDQWRRWVVDQYGSIQAAERAWGFKAPRNDAGQLTGPSDDQLATDGPWRVFVAAYRRFVDDLLSAGYGRSCRFIRRLDARHLISNRAGWGGTGNPHTVKPYQFDPLSGGAHLDFISPEAYGMRPTEGDYRRWGFIDAYCRWAGNGKPVFWSEFGSSIYPGYTPADYERQRAIWANVLRLVLFAGSDGDAGWWWPGGYRVNERSDFGCTEPWGKPRPSALELKKWASRICRRGLENRPVRYITIDRDTVVSGLAGLWQKHLDDYLRLADGKHVVRLRTAGDGVPTTRLRLVGVGNVPYRGVGPVKFLRSEFTSVTVYVAGSPYRPDSDLLWGDVTVRAPAGPATVAVTLLNTGEATWAAPVDPSRPQTGAVRLVDCASGRPLAAITHEVPRYGSASLKFSLPAGRPKVIALQLEAVGRGRFGQKLTVRIQPE